jgi:lipoate-protein ligase A
MLILESQSLDVYRNLAIEEYLMDQVTDMGPVLFLWQSDWAVVMGKNQNPWKECRLDRMREEHVPLARRISGGGTVYHDAGNLNYCVIVDRTDYNEHKAYDMVMQALRPMGIEAERTGKSNLSVDGLKFSGNAFCFRKGRAMHHGTLLLQTDLERLGRYLGCLFDSIETHAIASEPAAVVNLQLGKGAVTEALKKAFTVSYGGEPVAWYDSALDSTGLEPLIARQRSLDWQFGATPRFTVQWSGGRLEVVKDVIVDASGFDDASGLVQKRFSEVAFSWVC